METLEIKNFPGFSNIQIKTCHIKGMLKIKSGGYAIKRHQISYIVQNIEDDWSDKKIFTYNKHAVYLILNLFYILRILR